MKWGALAIGLAAIVPLSIWLRSRQDKIVWICAVMGLLPFLTQALHLYMAAISWPTWVGYGKGMEISLLDLLAAAVILGSARKNAPAPLLLPMGVYLATALLSAAQAQFPTATFFYAWQFFRAMMVYLAIYRAISVDFSCARAMLIGMAAGEIFELVLAGFQRFGLGMLQARGSMESQNELGLVTHFTMFPFFALMLGGRRGWLAPVVVLAGLGVDLLTTSRGSVGLGGVGLLVVYVLSTVMKLDARKAMVAVAGLALVAVAVPFALSSFDKRFEKDVNGVEISEDGERLAYKRAAGAMSQDHPAGVGANHFAFMGNVAGYYDQAGVAPYESGRAGNVHNVYLLVLAETGWLGLAAYVALMLFPLVTAFKYGVANIGEADGDLLLGLGVTLLVIDLHSWEEWVMITFSMQYFLALNFGMISALAMRLRANNFSLGAIRQPAESRF